MDNIIENNHCQYMVVRKKRFCRMNVKPGQKYCAEHQLNDKTESKDSLRIVCPLDPKHSCYASKLRKHLKICNARPKEPQPHIQKGINAGESTSENNEDSQKLLSSFSIDDVKNLISKVEKVFEEILKDKIKELFLTDEVVETEMKKPEYGDKTKKHLTQASAILGLLKNYDMIHPNTCYIEFGAGRGQLSYWLAQKPENQECSFLLIERSSPKHKKDNKLDNNEVQRIRADIADVVLDKLDAISKNSSVVGVTKHLCGEATDLALRCLTNVKQNEKKIRGCLMTFCCHHRCKWFAYTGKSFFEEIGFSKNDFEILCRISSWATCGSGLSREKEDDSSDVLQNERDKELGLTRQQKEELGRKAKNIINWGRAKCMEKFGFKVNLHFYVPTEISLENVCIVAYKELNT